MAKNTHKVPKKQWRKWNKIEQGMFNRVWNTLNPRQLNVLGIIGDHRKLNVIRWNLAWTMADLYKDWRGFWR